MNLAITHLFFQKTILYFLESKWRNSRQPPSAGKINCLGYPSLTITNVAGSTLSREASFTLLLHAGPEIAVASTKAYTAQIAVLTLLAKAIGDKKNLKLLLYSISLMN